MIPRPPRSTLPAILFPYTTLFRSQDRRDANWIGASVWTRCSGNAGDDRQGHGALRISPTGATHDSAAGGSASAQRALAIARGLFAFSRRSVARSQIGRAHV